MKIKMLTSIFLSILFFHSCTHSADKSNIFASPLSEDIQINQLGYFPDLTKHFYVADCPNTDFMLINEKGKTVYKGKLLEQGVWPQSGEALKYGDFTKLNKEGVYIIHIPALGNSYPFSISKDIYSEASVAALRTFYFQRTAMDMEEKYLDTFARPAGHPDDTCYFHPSSGYSEGFIASPKGWYDAGDYGKYIVNASIATGTMLAIHEIYPDLFADGSLSIPESGNGINDLLDEIKYELDWVLTMQDKDGGVFHKLTSLRHDAMTMPHETFSKRYIIGKSTAASLDFAALMAQASRLYKDVDEAFSIKSLDAAKQAYIWALKHPEEYFSNPEGVGTGPYNDKILKEEFFWAAAELFCTSGEAEYYEAIKKDFGKITFRLEESWRNYVDNIGYYSLLSSDKLNASDKDIIETSLLHLADSLRQKAQNSAYDIPVERFVWGSNSDVLNLAIIQLYAHKISGKEEYLNAAVLFTDYIFGKNATTYSFVSGFGSKTSNNFHHRLLMADDNEGAFPGFIAGGPNFQMQDAPTLKQAGVEYPFSLPAKAYIDHAGSYASNEICLNWNAPLVFVLAYLNMQNNE